MDKPVEFARVIASTRRAVTLSSDTGQLLKGVNRARSTRLAVGDHVRFTGVGGEAIIESLLPRKNCLKRAAPEREKLLAANLDHLFIVAAVPPLFNTIFIDRIAAAATLEEIPCSLLLNKIDLGLDPAFQLLRYYNDVNLPTALMSVKEGTGMSDVRQMLENPLLQQVALAGVSGVGKSSILNYLIPNARSRVGEVSRKTGQGRQTTSSSFAYEYLRSDGSKLFIIDLPGVQQYGLSYLSREQLRWAFPEIRAAGSACQFADCLHRAEPGCEVKWLVEQGKIAASRYDSYCGILDELDSIRSY